MFCSLEIENFRGISSLKIEKLKQFNLIVGRNNSGKTSILESLFLLTNPINVQNPIRINAFRGIQKLDNTNWLSNFREMNSSKTIKLCTDICKQGNENRELKINAINNIDNKIELIQKDNTIKVDSQMMDSITTKEIGALGLSLVYKIIKENEKPQEFHYKIKNDPNGLFFEGVPQGYEEKMNAVMVSPSTLKLGLVDKLSFIQFRKQNKELIQYIKYIDETIEELKIGSDGTIFADCGFETLIPVNLLGDGTIKFMAIILTLFNYKNGALLIDEIENDLHYSALEKMWECIFKTAIELNIQIFATSHSYECIQAFHETSMKFDELKDQTQVIKVTKKDSKHKATLFDQKLLKTALESDWELR